MMGLGVLFIVLFWELVIVGVLYHYEMADESGADKPT